MSRFHVITTRQQSLPFDNDKKFVRHQIIIKFNSLFYIARYRSQNSCRLHIEMTQETFKVHLNVMCVSMLKERYIWQAEFRVFKNARGS